MSPLHGVARAAHLLSAPAHRPADRAIRAEAHTGSARQWLFGSVRGTIALTTQCALTGEFALRVRS